MLLSGPESVYPADGDGHSYLSSTLSIEWHSETMAKWWSLSVYCDANGSDEEGYLEPMLRVASWERENDIMLLRPPWPSVVVHLHVFPIDSSLLQASVRRIQDAVGQVPLLSQGLPTRRNFGVYPGDARGHLTIKVKSGWQDRELSVYVAETPALYETALQVEAELRQLAIPVARGDWLERYDQGPDELLARESWYWDGTLRSD